jgi:hypothetical protein
MAFLLHRFFFIQKAIYSSAAKKPSIPLWCLRRNDHEYGKVIKSPYKSQETDSLRCFSLEGEGYSIKNIVDFEVLIGLENHF